MKNTDYRKYRHLLSANEFYGIRSILLSFFTLIGEVSLFAVQVFKNIFSRPFEYREINKQAFNVGNKSIFLIITTGFILGIVITMQAQPILVQFGAQSFIPAMVSIAVVRELGPVVTGLLAAGKISSGIAAEIGAMRVTEQIDAMEVSGTNPLHFVVATRVIASTFMVPVLAVFFETFTFIGTFVAINGYEDMSIQLFITKSIEMLTYNDIIPSVIKTFIFGFTVGIIGAYKGYYAMKGTESVGKSANSAVVIASLSIFLIDFIVMMLTKPFM